MQLAVVPIPHGIFINGSWQQRVGLRELNGYDEQLLVGIDNYPIPYQTTALLERVVRFGDIGSNNADLVRQLTVGDRIALTLHIRTMMLGDKFSCVLACPECKQDMSMDLSVSTFLQPPIHYPKTEYPLNIENFSLKVRPVTGGDLESILVNNGYNNNNGSNSNVRAGNKAEALVRLCIVSSDPPLPDNLSEDFVRMISSKLQEIDTQADLVLDLTCPNCKHSFQTTFNVEEFIFHEIKDRINQLEREVHWLAFNYHWSEDSILSLPINKRKRYIDLINRTISGESA